MRHYLKLFLALVKNNIIREMEFRVNLFLSATAELLWIVFQLFVIDIYFQFTDTLIGWTKWEIVAFIGVYRIIRSLFDLFVRKNFSEFPEQINKGNFDYVLTKPVNSLFLSSLRRHRYQDLVDFVGGIGLIVYSLNTIGQVLDWRLAIILAAVSVTGFIGYYSLFLIFTTLAVFMTRMTAISDLNNVVSNVLRYPASTFSRGDRLGEILLMPLAVITTYPAQVFLGRESPAFFILEVVLVSGLFFLAYRFWNFALKHYSSASS